MHWRFLWRELLAARRQAAVFLLCVALSITSLTAVNAFRRDADQLVQGDARALHGGDVLITSHYPISQPLLAAVAELRGQGAVLARSWEMYSIVRAAAGDANLLSRVKVVDVAYPLYGEVVLESGRPLAEQLRPGAVVAGADLQARLGLRIGDRLRLGAAELTLVDLVLRESSRPVEVFSLGPSLLVSAADLERLELVLEGSRVEYGLAIKLPAGSHAEKVADQLRARAGEGSERVDTAASARSGVKRFFDNLLFFLSLTSLSTLLLAGIGMYTAISALLREREATLAICRSLGAGHLFLLRHYLLLVLIVGALGSLLGAVAGFFVHAAFPLLFPGLLPGHQAGGLHPADLTEALTVGMGTAALFTALPLYRLREVKPVLLFRRDSGPAVKGLAYWLVVLLALLLLALLVFRQLGEGRTSLYFLAAMAGLTGVALLLTSLVLWLAGRWPPRRLMLRQALRSLLRPGNATRPVVVTLAAALALLLTMHLVQRNLHANFVASFPAGAPNVFVLNIQKDQRPAFQELAGVPVEFYPVVRGRLKAINGQAVQMEREQQKRGDSLAREFNLTYRETLLPDERLVAGDSLFVRDGSGQLPLQVSILDTVMEMGDMRLGDMLHFTIQGVPLSAKITSIRSRIQSRLAPFFYFVFPEQYLRAAPQNAFTALRLAPEAIVPLQGRIAREMPNLSVINASETAAELARVMARLSRLVSFFALFSIAAGLLILASSLLATRLARLREAVYYAVLGAPSAFIRWVFVMENLLLGSISALLAVLLAEISAWAVCVHLLDLVYTPQLASVLFLLLGTVLTVGLVGGFGSLSAVQAKPALFLREHTEE